MKRKNKVWTEEEKIKIVKEKLAGGSYRDLANKYDIKSEGMIANWKRKYENGESLAGKQGRKKLDKDLEYEILKKSFALLKKIRGESHESNDIK
ncbi:MAG: helix-turn-helix domain-containing protein [Erysipelotrichaceae bacterium]|nr:helix-turn-helix domain-containing protein [Erysipelotrichaceae bacterium]